jgi:hypothetical protein
VDRLHGSWRKAANSGNYHDKKESDYQKHFEYDELIFCGIPSLGDLDLGSTSEKQE